MINKYIINYTQLNKNIPASNTFKIAFFTIFTLLPIYPPSPPLHNSQHILLTPHTIFNFHIPSTPIPTPPFLPHQASPLQLNEAGSLFVDSFFGIDPPDIKSLCFLNVPEATTDLLLLSFTSKSSKPCSNSIGNRPKWHLYQPLKPFTPRRR